VNVILKRSKLGYYFASHPRGPGRGPLAGDPADPLQERRRWGSPRPAPARRLLRGPYIGFIEPQAVFGIDVSIQLVLTCIIGGSDGDWPLIGAVVLALLSEALRTSLARRTCSSTESWSSW